MGAVGALLAAGLDQPLGLEPLQHLVQQQELRLPSHQPRRKLGQDAEVEPWVSQLQSKGILPIDPPAHSVSGLAVAQVLEKLEDCDQRQSPRRQPRLAHGWDKASGNPHLDTGR